MISKLIDMSRGETAIFSQSDTLDSLWDQAEKLGRVEVDRSWTRPYTPTVTIMLERSSGTTVYAKGSHSEIREAFRLAIREANLLKG